MNWRKFRKAPTVAERRARAKREAAKLAKAEKGDKAAKASGKDGAKKKNSAASGSNSNPDNGGPVEITSRKIATSFWGNAWCKNLERYHDYHSRLGRGRSYVRSGCVIALSISAGEIKARVSGSRVYKVTINVKPLGKRKWHRFRETATAQMSSVIDLLRGDIPTDTLELAVDRKNGLFPAPGEINLQCNCPDWANMCKHVAAVLYGVGNRLDEHPELFFILRDCDLEELRSVDIVKSVKGGKGADKSNRSTHQVPTLKRVSEEKLGKLFGIDLESPG